MSSRSKGVTYCVFSSVMRSRVIESPGLLRLHLLLRDAGVRMLAETPLDESRDLECVLAGLAEEREELGGPRVRLNRMRADVNQSEIFRGRDRYASASTTSDWKWAISFSDSGRSLPSSISPERMPACTRSMRPILGAHLGIEGERLLDPRLVGVLGHEVVDEAVRLLQGARDDRADGEVRSSRHDVDDGAGEDEVELAALDLARRVVARRAARACGGPCCVMRAAPISRRYASGVTSMTAENPGCAVGQW